MSSHKFASPQKRDLPYRILKQVTGRANAMAATFVSVNIYPDRYLPSLLLFINFP